jgi:predicted Rossmann fold flavoprotein
VVLKTRSSVTKIEKQNHQFYLTIGDHKVIADRVIVTTGGSPKLSGLKWLAELGHKIEPPVPSLFTFNMPHESIKNLMGIVVEQARVKIVGENWEGNGPLLITHWGMSGPAILVLSSFGARRLSELDYIFDIEINWIDEPNHEHVRKELTCLIEKHNEKQLSSIRPYFLPSRLWHFLIEKHKIPSDKKWKELSKKEKNRIVQFLTNDRYKVEGKTTFKEEFVTCGGVSLEDVNMKTMESKKCPGLYFAGEVLDIDAITGGYNFQAAWTTSFIAARLNT